MTRYTYDALNRITDIELDNLDTITFQYDTESNTIGRLNKITDASGQTAWTYSTRIRIGSIHQWHGQSIIRAA